MKNELEPDAVAAMAYLVRVDGVVMIARESTRLVDGVRATQASSSYGPRQIRY